MAELTQAYIREILNYDPETGVFTWRIKPNGRVEKGAVAGSLTVEGYVAIKINRISYPAHRLAWLYVHGVWPEHLLDHKHHTRSDNRLVELRPATRAENARNQRLRKTNTSGFKGVSWHKGRQRWSATICVGMKSKHLGLFDNPAEAHAAYCEAARKYHGEFASLK